MKGKQRHEVNTTTSNRFEVLSSSDDEDIFDPVDNDEQEEFCHAQEDFIHEPEFIENIAQSIQEEGEEQIQNTKFASYVSTNTTYENEVSKASTNQ